MMDAPHSDQNNASKRNKRWRHFRNKKNKPKNLSSQQPNPIPSSKPIQNQGKPQQQSSFVKGKGTSFDTEKRSQAREILPQDYKVPEDLDIPTYVFGVDDERPSNGEEPTSGEETQVICPLCQYPIKKFYTTLRHPSHDALVHFDCALRELFHQNKTRLAKDERVYYIGAGRFAIIKEIRDKRGNVKNYQIIEKIEYEKHD